jgi:hypothetical protein
MKKNTGAHTRATQLARNRVFESYKGWEQERAMAIQEEKAALIPLPEYKEFLDMVGQNKERNA